MSGSHTGVEEDARIWGFNTFRLVNVVTSEALHSSETPVTLSVDAAYYSRRLNLHILDSSYYCRFIKARNRENVHK